MKTISIAFLSILAGLASPAAENFPLPLPVAKLVENEEVFTRFVGDVLGETEELLEDTPLSEVTRQRLLLRIRVHSALYLGDHTRALDTVSRIRALIEDADEKAYSGITTHAYVAGLRASGQKRLGPEFRATFERVLSRSLRELPASPAIASILQRQRGSFAAISAENLRMEARKLGRRLDAVGGCNLLEADRIVQIGHRLVDIVPLRDAILRALDEAISSARTTGPAFTKKQLDSFFYAEGAAIADFDGDGHPDVAAGPRVFSGPDFEKSIVYRSPHAFDRLSYSNNFITFADDFNGDRRSDILVIGWPGREAFWFENPGATRTGDWPQHLVYSNVNTESPGFVDVDGDGLAEIVAGSGARLGYMQRNGQDPQAPWTFHAISPPGKWQRYTHGIGLGDVNGDGRPDFLEANGWWEQPPSLAGDPAWKFHPHSFGPGGAQMYAYDVNGDGLADIVTSIEAHGYGLGWFEQRVDGSGHRTWIERVITSRRADEKIAGVQFSQPHAVMLEDIDGDGLKDLIVGKRHWAHGDKGDPEPNAPAVLYWFKLVRGADGAKFIPRLIDDASGAGCQFPVADLNGDGRPDLAIANKKGVFIFRQ